MVIRWTFHRSKYRLLFLNLEVYNNTFYNCNERAILFSNAAYNNAIVKNNIFYNDAHSSASLIEIQNSSYLSNITLDNNLYDAVVGSEFNISGTDRTLSYFKSTYSQEAHFQSGNPQFISSTNFHLTASSTNVIDKGTNLSGKVDNDFDGIQSPYGSGYDIGAYEYGSTHGTSNTKLNIKILLEGPFNNGSMSTNLLTNGYISLSQPYNQGPWNYKGTESVSSIPSGVVDWVLLELRSGTASSTLVSRKAAFVKNNGSVVDLDGVSMVSFNGISAGNYYIVVHHRNHLAVMSANAVTLSSNSTLYDFTTSSSKAYGTDPMADLGGGKWGLYAGDSDRNGTVNVLDYGNVVNFLFDTGYKSGDLDLNGVINVLDYSKTNNNLFKSSQVP